MPTATRTRRIVRQKRKGPIDPSLGERLRTLRVARGLTQAHLAGDDFTKGFISLVETGRTRISLRAAEIFAQRLGVPVSDLMRPSDAADAGVDLELVRAESELLAGNSAAVLELVRQLERKATARTRSRLHRLRGRALVQSGRPREALSALDAAVREFRATGDRDMVARSLLELASAHAQLEQHGEALNLALQCEYAISDGAIVDQSFELEVLSFLASVLVTLGDFTAADVRADRARALAEDVADPRAVAGLYYNLAVTRQRQGDDEAALSYARRSLAAYERIGDARAIGSTWNTIGWVYIKRGQHGRAAEALRTADALANQNRDGRLAAYVLQNRAELELAKGNAASALELATQSIEHPEASARCKAISLLVSAQALAQTKVTDAKVMTAFREAAAALEPHGRRLLARTHQAEFEALTARGRTREANSAAKRAIELLQPEAG